MGTFVTSVVYVVCVLLHRFYIRYIAYSIKLFFSANGEVLGEFNKSAKDKGYSGHKLRVAQWEYFKKSEDSQWGYLVATTLPPLFMGFLYMWLFFYVFDLIFGS